MESTPAHDAPPEPYQYLPLPTARSIRLINFCSRPSGEHSIQINLATHTLEEAPPFVALSYTWGNPTLPFSEQAQIAEIVYESTGEIIVEGHVFEVKYNLLDALEMLRDLPSSNIEQYFWIDAICINQQDLVECGAQVSIMSDIYGKSKKVIVWMGQEDEFFEDALSLLKSVGSIPVERHSEVTLRDWFNQEAVFRRLGRHQAPETRHWLGIIAFLNRPFFERVWIVQEVIFGKDVTVACGNETFPWELVSNTLSFIIASGWEDYLSSGYFKGAIPVMPGGDGRPSMYQEMIQRPGIGIVASAIYLEATRSGINKANHPAIFRYLIEAFRSSKASNPRDMIYALLSLGWKDRPPFSTHPGVLVPDYEIPVKDLFIKTARVMFECTKDLRYLCHVEDRSERQLRDLPSWVPDYTAYLRPVPFYLQRLPGPNMHHNASKGIKQYQDPGGLTSDHLLVLGFCLSRIAEVAGRFPMGNWVESSTDDGAASLIESWHQIFQFAAQISETQMKTLNQSVGRCEVLWRSLCGNHLQRQYPAPESVNLIFFRWLCIWCVARTFVWEEHQFQLNSAFGLPGGPKLWERLMNVFHLLFDQEPETSEFQMSAFESLFGESIIGATHWTDFEWFRSSFSDWWKDVNAHCGTRRQFQDNDGRLCVGPLSSEKGDEIWIIGGAPEPYLLRNISNGNYTVVGQVYIHGIMDGELADMGLLQDVEQITLV